MKILITGAAGFIGGYLVRELLDHGWHVIGLDNYSKYGPVKREHDTHERYTFLRGDAKDPVFLREALHDCEHFVMGAAMIGGIAYFHRYAYDLMAENERLMAAAFDAAIPAYKGGRLHKVTVMSSSMVFEKTSVFPTPEQEIYGCPPPSSTYGFQKLACEYFARGAYMQHGLPYTIVRPFNCVGIGEGRAKGEHDVISGNVKLAMSHVVPDLIQKILKGQSPLHILGDGQQLRHYTYGGDLARGIRLTIESPKAENQDFNLSTETGTTVLELAELIWKKIKGEEPFRYVSDAPFEFDVRVRSPNVSKAKEILGFEATAQLGKILDEVIPWVTEGVEKGAI